ncbi:TlpA disulfide reductase family protein [Actimicrobium antarcticum]|uniref:Thioredoxin domain-containing protein n=1 Tax=Actimicrobium antarcticum TaxID=1051899 RepID=A0ABP7TYK3_9BURK
MDFELAGEHGFVRLSGLPAQATLINFWRSDCPPCVREMPVLAGLAHAGSVRVMAVAVQRPSDTLTAPESVARALRSPVQLLHAPAEPRGILARFGNVNGVLPYTTLLHADRSICAKHAGEIDAAWVEAMVNRCHNAESGRR